MRADELIQKLRRFPPDSIVCLNGSMVNGPGREVDPIEYVTRKDARQVEKTGPLKRYKLGPGGVTILLLGSLASVVVGIRPAEAAFDCGRYMSGVFGIADKAYNLALHWSTLRRTSPQPGAVVVQRRPGRNSGGGPGGHVSRIVTVVDSCHAVVKDNRGTYKRDICRNLVAYVQP